MPESRLNIKMRYTGFVICLGTFCNGVTIGWTASAYNCALAEKQQWRYDWVKWLPVVHTIGGLVMMIPGYKLCNFFGPKCAMSAFIFPGLMGWTLITIPNAMVCIYLGFFLLGGSVTTCGWIGRIYLTQISRNSCEEMVFLNKMMFSFGLIYICVLGCILKNVYLLNTFSMGPNVLFLLGTFTIPESPLFLLREGHYQSAEKALSRLRPTGHVIEIEIEEKLDFLLTLKSRGYLKFRNVFTKAHRKSFLLMFVLLFLGQMTGMETVYFYSGMDPLYANALQIKPKYLALMFAIAVMIFVFATFKLSTVISIHRQSILASVLLSIIGFVITVYATCFKEGKQMIVPPWFLIVCLILYNCAYNIGYSSLPMIIAQQLFDKGVEHVVLPVLQTANLSFRLLVIVFYLYGLTALGIDRIVTIFTFFNFLSVLFTAFHLPRVGVPLFASFEDY